MNVMQPFLKQLKPSRPRKTPDPHQPVSYWSEQDRLHETVVDAFVIILRTRGCSWMFQSGCTMCGYFNDSMLSEVKSDQLINQYQQAMEKYNDEPIVKIFTSGSFLDLNEIPLDVQKYILSDLQSQTTKIAIESRPEYVTKTSMDFLKTVISTTELDIGLGLETSNDALRKRAINKGFTFKEYIKAIELIHNYQFFVKTYVLIKPPFITEKEAIKDAKQTIDTVLKHTTKDDIISFNPTSIQKNTLVEYLWRKHQYRPPWIWSIIDILTYAKNSTEQVRFQCDITGGGRKRGAHNCLECDHTILDAIKDFSVNQNLNVFQNLTCSCKNLWQDQLRLEPLTFGSIPDVMYL